jgi:2,3-bisphosphoglycerate-dependent phosphoglycerate mutase
MKKCNLFVFRHAETTDNRDNIFSGWRDPDLTEKGVLQAQEVAQQLAREKIDFAFTSHLKRAKRTLELVLEKHPAVPVFVDDRLIERCYGTLQGKSKLEAAAEDPEWFAKIHRGYDFAPPEGESIHMVERRILPFVEQLKECFGSHPCNVAISCHGNSMRPIRRVFEHLNLEQMLKLENPQGQALEYALQIHHVHVNQDTKQQKALDWEGVFVPLYVQLATDPQNPLKKYY